MKELQKYQHNGIRKNIIAKILTFLSDFLYWLHTQ